VRQRTAPDLERVALLLAEVLGQDGVLVGGLAVGAHGYVRATDDVDFVARIALAEVRQRLRGRGIASAVRRGDPTEGGFDCLRGVIDGVRFDVMPPLVQLDWERAIEVPMTRRDRLRVVDLDGLIRLKLRAQGPRDLMDVAALALAHPDCLERARDAARAYGALDRLDLWLADPRLQAEMKAAGRRRRAGARRKGANRRS
jgi:hypothetical protein